MKNKPSLKSEATWYVYKLIDPRCGSVFYVGKGSGLRIDQHEKDAASAKRSFAKKLLRIKEIWAAGLAVQKAMAAFFWDEQAAYDHETDLIESIGLSNLTNVLPGGQTAWERRKAERKARRQTQAPDEWMPLNIADMRRDTIGQPIEFFGMYINLLEELWLNGGQLANDDAALRKSSGATQKQWQAHRKALAGLFVVDADKWTHSTMTLAKNRGRITQDGTAY